MEGDQHPRRRARRRGAVCRSPGRVPGPPRSEGCVALRISFARRNSAFSATEPRGLALGPSGQASGSLQHGCRWEPDLRSGGGIRTTRSLGYEPSEPPSCSTPRRWPHRTTGNTTRSAISRAVQLLGHRLRPSCRRRSNRFARRRQARECRQLLGYQLCATSTTSRSGSTITRNGSVARTPSPMWVPPS